MLRVSMKSEARQHVQVAEDPVGGGRPRRHVPRRLVRLRIWGQ